ncbi:MAG: DUF429 domain-containing protein [Saprospiraceae bacterium]|nr:DUF429 domain-containing protein [Saprospiraceae bacterium]
MTLAGIDYGSKLAGTTVFCFNRDNRLFLKQSEKKRDADAFVRTCLSSEGPGLIGIDAPLSLPLAYKEQGSDYFYRACDRELSAMSPMFLGGLTARAMKLSAEIRSQGIQCIEVYPKAMLRELHPQQEWYKKDLASAMQFCGEVLPLKVEGSLKNWHQFDAVLAWLSTWRFAQGTSQTFGHADEGQIVV